MRSTVCRASFVSWRRSIHPQTPLICRTRPFVDVVLLMLRQKNITQSGELFFYLPVLGIECSCFERIRENAHRSWRAVQDGEAMSVIALLSGSLRRLRLPDNKSPCAGRPCYRIDCLRRLGFKTYFGKAQVFRQATVDEDRRITPGQALESGSVDGR